MDTISKNTRKERRQEPKRYNTLHRNYIVATNTNAGALNNVEKVLFVCQICNTPFKSLQKLFKHRKRQHDEIDQEERGSKRKDNQQNSYKKKQFRQ